MTNRPLTFVLTERKSTLGKLKGKVVIQARPTGRKRVHHRSFCTEVAHGTTFSGAEVEAVLRLAAEIAKRHVENGDIVDFGDIVMSWNTLMHLLYFKILYYILYMKQSLLTQTW